MRRIVRGVSVWSALLAAMLISGPVQAAISNKSIDRRFPAQFCPIDNDDFILEFVADTSRARLTFKVRNFGLLGGFLGHQLDNVAVVDRTTFLANRVVTPGYSFCYQSPGHLNTKGYDFSAAGTTESFLDLFDADADGWDLTNRAFFATSSAPRNPPVGNDNTGRSIGLGKSADGDVEVSTSVLVSGLTPGVTYVITGWWQEFDDDRPLNITIDTAPCADRDADGLSECDGDCNDTDAKIRTGRAETCDGRDEDCDGSIDEIAACNTTCDVPAKLGSDQRVTNASFLSVNPSLAWDGRGYGIVWRDNRDSGSHNIFFQRVDANGTTISSQLALTVSDGNERAWPRIVWNGTYYGVAWAENTGFGSRIVFARVDLNGNVVGTKVLLGDTPNTRNSIDPDIAWTGTEFDLVWSSSNGAGSSVWFARIGPDGARTSIDVLAYDAAANSDRPRLAWSGSLLGVAWVEGSAGAADVWFGRIDRLAGLVTGAIKVSNVGFINSGPSVAWSGSEYAASWSDSRFSNDEIFLRRLSSAGALVGTELRVTNNAGASSRPSLVWTGAEYGLTWEDDRSGDTELYYARVSSAAVKLGSDVRLTNSIGTSWEPSLAWGGSKFGVAWRDDRPGDDEIYFLRLGCDCIDTDGDGWSNCIECDDTQNSVRPNGTQSCDGRNNDCNDPNWPLLTNTNEGDDDLDGSSECAGDCSDTNAAIWAQPGEARSLTLTHVRATGVTTLTWLIPTAPGGTSVLYDTLRATGPTAFGTAVCVETNDGSNTTATDSVKPAVANAFDYLVRAENSCPSSGQGSLGKRSDGTDRTGRACP